MENARIVFDAIFSKATTTVDGGWRISFDLASHEGENVSALAKLTQQALKIVVVTDDARDED